MKHAVRLFFVLLISIVIGNDAMSGSFSADYSMAYGNDYTLTGKIFVCDSLYSYNITTVDQDAGVIVNTKKGTATILFRDIKKYFNCELSMLTLIGIMNPIQSYNYYISDDSSKEHMIRQEEIEGLKCDVYRLEGDSCELALKWVSQELKFPIKIVQHLFKDLIFELANISNNSVDSTNFMIPGDYNLLTFDDIDALYNDGNEEDSGGIDKMPH